MAATCGNCGLSGQSVSHVKACYAGRQEPGTAGVDNALGSYAAADTGHSAAPEPVEITEGFWQLGKNIYKVQRSQSSGYLYAKMLDVGSWGYAPGGINRLRTEGATPLTEEAAAQYGKLYGRCALCGRTLTNEESIERGIGPICAGKQGW